MAKGNEFLVGAIMIKDPQKPNSAIDHSAPTVAYYLVSHSVELFLKAFLRAKGSSVESLKKIGHDLDKALKRSRDRGLSELTDISDEEESEIKLLNKTYCSKDFEYFKRGYFELPYYERICSLAERLRSSIKETAKEASNFKP